MSRNREYLFEPNLKGLTTLMQSLKELCFPRTAVCRTWISESRKVEHTNNQSVYSARIDGSLDNSEQQPCVLTVIDKGAWCKMLWSFE
ncbi:MAG: hypothetical protein CSA81_08900 [Acidobacteria bacterium]|nr:MAG: hypothetical protein CSA81_08900 [Acidobacteriota bacterium]